VLCDGHPAFINCSRQMLLTEYFALLPPNEVVVRFRKPVAADEEVKEACKRLKRADIRSLWTILLRENDREALVPYADFIKVDIRTVTPEQSAILTLSMAASIAECWRKKWKLGHFSG